MQTMQVFSRLHGNLSYFRNIYDDFAVYKATLNRLTGFEQAVNAAYELPSIQRQVDNSCVVFDDLTVQTPDGRVLINGLNLILNKGDRLLIKGKSGLGKTTLLRSVAGLWAWAKGGVRCPEHGLFLSQKPYLPQGRLIDVLYYPSIAPNESNVDTAEMARLLTLVQLGHLIDRLYEAEDWTRVLSLGEQQRIAIMRVMIHRPDVLFMDEATASMDEGLEDAMYRTLMQALPESIIISVGHRSTLMNHHNRCLQALGDGEWEVLEL